MRYRKNENEAFLNSDENKKQRIFVVVVVLRRRIKPQNEPDVSPKRMLWKENATIHVDAIIAQRNPMLY